MEWNFLFFMNSVLLGVGLAMDAFSVSLANGMNEKNMKKSRMAYIAGVYAFFQFLMPMIGWICVHTIVQVFGQFQKFIPWIALILLLYIGGSMIKESMQSEEEKEEVKRLSFAVLPIEELSQKTGKCKSSVKKALKELDDAGLLIRKFGGFSKPRHMYVMIPDKVEVSGKVQLQTDIKKADREFKNELSYGQNDNSTKDINTTSNKVIEKNNSSNKYGVSSYSIKNQKMNYECGEGESL